MAAKTESNYESDEEFEERTSDELWTFYFGRLLDVDLQLEHELCKKRFDRVERIIENLLKRYPRNLVSAHIEEATMTASQFMPAAECPEVLQFIFSHFADSVSEDARQKMVLKAALFGGNDSVDTLCCFVGDSFVRKVMSEFEGCRSRSALCCKLIQASMRGDLAEVERYLAIQEKGMCLFCPHVNEYVVKAAAEHGHTHIIDTILAEWQRRANSLERHLIYWELEEMLWIACRDGNLEMAVSMLWAMDDLFGSKNSPRSSRLVSPEIFCTAEFLRKVISAVVARLDRLGYKMNPGCPWIKVVLENAV